MRHAVLASTLLITFAASAVAAPPPRPRPAGPGAGAPGPGPAGPGPAGTPGSRNPDSSSSSNQKLEVTGWLTDSHCGTRAANKEHTAACVEKCVRGGAKAQIVSEGDAKVYDLDSSNKVRPYVGQRVTVTGTLQSSTGVLVVQAVKPAPAALGR